MVWVKESSVKRLPKEIARLYEDFAPEMDGRLGCPSNFNRLTMGWYLNDSKTPNVECVGNFDFRTIEDIETGDELTVDYSKFPRSLG
jgi:hypothetical protein